MSVKIRRFGFLRQHSVVPSAVRKPPRIRARNAILWFVVAVPIFVLFATLAAEWRFPERTDPDYSYRQSLLRKRMTERPHSHTVLVVGSSRTAHGFLPESVPLSPDQERPILWFNFSHIGYGPVMNCLTLHRLIHDGIQPNCIVLEIMPAFFVKEDSRFQVGHINARELLILNRYSPFLSAEKAYLWTRLDKLRAIQPFREPFTGVAHLELFGGWTAFDHQPALPEKRDERLAAQRDSIAGYLRNVHARPGAIRALHDSISICRENGIQLILLRTPEGPVARSWYDAEKLAAFDRWIQSLAEAKAIPVVDARDWLVEDDFKDSHHPNRNGAITFTARLLRELTPMLDR